MFKITNALKQSDLFKNLSDDDLNSIASTAKIRQFFPEETIVWQGNPSDSLYIITNGIVSVKRVLSADNAQILAYLMPGQTFGEVGILENRPRSANVEAVSDVDVLVIRRKEFLKILHQFPSVAVELARMLGRYLMESNRRQSRKSDNIKVVLVFDLFEGIGATTMGTILTRFMQEKTRKPTVYTEYPNAQQLIQDFNLDKRTKTYNHSSGYDMAINLPRFMGTSGNFQASSFLNYLMGKYENIIITVKRRTEDVISEDLIMMLDYADQILIPIPPDKEISEQVEESLKRLKKHIDTKDTSIFTIIARTFENQELDTSHIPHDFELPFEENFPTLAEIHKGASLPPHISETVETFVDRLDRTNQVGVFIPTTVDVDKTIDTEEYVNRALNFLAERFGGATSKEASGVWNSQEIGLVGEKVFIVHTYVTPSDLNKYLDEVVDFIKDLKIELRQEAMALEVNQQLTLI